MQELTKSQNQDLRADPAWSINSGKMESNLVDFPGFKRPRAAANYSRPVRFGDTVTLRCWNLP